MARSRLHVMLSVTIASLLLAALFPASSAQATDHMPWDQPGSAWQGSMSITSSSTAEVDGRRFYLNESANLSQLVRLPEPPGVWSDSDGEYAAFYQGHGVNDHDGSPCPEGSPAMWDTYREEWGMSAHTDAPVFDDYGGRDVLVLQTGDDGVTSFFAGTVPPPQYQHATWTSCDGETSPSGVLAQSLYPPYRADGMMSVPIALPDSDPDPLHLVGQRTWTLSDPPYPLDPMYTSVLYEVSYDLHLVADPPEEEPCDGLMRAEVLGRQPGYVALDRKLSSFPNKEASCSGMWAPHLDAGFVPQGIAPAGDRMWVAGYFKTHKDDKPVECAVYQMDPETGRRGLGYMFTKEHLNWASVAAGFDSPRKCGHAGGVSVLPDGRLLVVDTKSLFVLNPARFGQSNPFDQVIKLVDPFPDDDKKFNGSFLVDGVPSSDPQVATIWIGTWSEASSSTLRRFTVAEILAAPENTLSPGDDDLSAMLSLPVGSQGGAFAPSGELLITSSVSRCGKLSQVDPATGSVTGQFGFGAGVEEIQFVGDRLWATFEAGTRLYIKKTGAKFFPLIASFDPTKITEGPESLAQNPFCVGLQAR